MPSAPIRILHVDLDSGKGKAREFGDPARLLGGSALAAALFQEFGRPGLPASDPAQPLIFAIGPLTGYFPLMSKVVCGFMSPYTGHYAESHAGGRLAMALRFTGYQALMITGRAKGLSCLTLGSRRLDVYDVHYLRGQDVFVTGKLLRRLGQGDSAGHRSIMRIGPAGEAGSAFACINVDTYRHFGRLGAGAVMGGKNLKAVTVVGDADLPLPPGKAYPDLYKSIHAMLTGTDMMRKYHDLGTAENLIPLNELRSLPWRNLQVTSDPGVEAISGERFAEQLLLRQSACSGCPVGCIHIGLLRQQFAKDHQFLYRQVNYDYEPIFSLGSMLGMRTASDVLALMDECEKQGLDVMSAGVALAWATEAFERGLVGEAETGAPLAFDNAAGYVQAIRRLGVQEGDFYKALAQGALKAAAVYGGADFACVLGQEMAGYATGEVYFVAQALGFRHSHLDSGAYTYDQKVKEQDADKAVDFLVRDEAERVMLTSMVSCLFARKAYTPERLQEALAAVDARDVADNLEAATLAAQRLRWRLKLACGFDPDTVPIPKRFHEVATWKGPVDSLYLETMQKAYSLAIRRLAKDDS